MSAIALTILNQPNGGALSGTRSGRHSDQEKGAAETFDAMLVESARGAAAPTRAEGVGGAQTEAAAVPPAGVTASPEKENAATLGAGVSGDDPLRDLLTLSPSAKDPQLIAGATPFAAPRAVAAGVTIAAAFLKAAGREATAIHADLREEDVASRAMAERASSAISAKVVSQAPVRLTLADFMSRDLEKPAELPLASSKDAVAKREASAAAKSDNSEKAPSADATPATAVAAAQNAATTPAANLQLAAAAIAQSLNTPSANRGKMEGRAQRSAEDGESSARIATGAAPRRVDATPAAQPATGAETARPTAEPEMELAPTRVHIVDLKTWHEPTAPNGSSSSTGLLRQSGASEAAAQKNSPPDARAAPKTPGAMPAAAPSKVEALTPPPAPQIQTADKSASARAVPSLPTSAGGATTVAGPANGAGPRRDLELTLEPKELGGLSVRMRSRGDRLEIAFVAEKGDTARLIDDKSATLQGRLHEAGLGLGGVDIRVAEKPSTIIPSAAGGPSVGTPQSGGRNDSGSTPPRPQFTSRVREDMTNETSSGTDDPLSPRGDRGLYL